MDYIIDSMHIYNKDGKELHVISAVPVTRIQDFRPIDIGVEAQTFNNLHIGDRVELIIKKLPR